MEKILIIHNEYKERGGEDIAVEDEIKFLSDHFEVDTVLLLNKIEKPYSQFLSFLTLNNPESNKLIKKKLDEFAPDVIYIHNTWFKASLGIFKTLEEYGVPIYLKLHNLGIFVQSLSFLKNISLIMIFVLLVVLEIMVGFLTSILQIQFLNL